MKRAGIIGWPLSHSLSPLLHGYWLKQYGVDGEFQRLPARPEEFAGVVEKARKDGFAGLNVTVPHKETAFKLAASHDKAVEICEAVNLLLFQDGKILGRNTDHVGMRKSLEEAMGENSLAGKTVVMLGAGGAARGAILALDEMGAGQIHVFNRHQARAESLSHAMALKVKVKLLPGPMSGWTSVAGGAALLLNTSSAGMKGNDPLELDLAPLPRASAVCDIVYNPLETQLLKDAGARGHKTIDGLGMLMHQAAPSFEAFYGVRPEVTAGLRAALVEALNA
jgi:shikimate dehydrogenase